MKKGFTLIELLTVIAIIAVLSTAGFALLNPAYQLQKARDSRRKTDIGQIQAALELYRADQGAYPAALSELTSGSTIYLRSIPSDPKNTGQYIYTYLPVGTPPATYSIVGCLENVNDSQRDLPPTYPSSGNNTTYCTGGNTNWSYTVKNP